MSHGAGGESKARSFVSITSLTLGSFYINLPIGAAVMLGFFLTFQSPDRSRDQSAKDIKPSTWMASISRFDPLGTVIFIPAIICLLLALEWGGTKYAWTNGRIIALFAVSAALLIAFCFIQKLVGENATLPVRIVNQRSMMASMWFTICLNGSFYIPGYFLPIWFQAIKGVSAFESGIMGIPLLLGLIIMSVVAGVAVTTFGYYMVAMIISSVIMTIAAGLLTTFKTTSGPSAWIGFQALFGIGIGLGFQQPLTCVQTVFGLDDAATAISAIMFLQSLGGALFVSVASNVFNVRLVNGLSSVPGVTPAQVLQAGATNLMQTVAPEHINQVRVIYNQALTNTWYVAVALAAMSLVGAVFVEWRSVREIRPGRRWTASATELSSFDG